MSLSLLRKNGSPVLWGHEGSQQTLRKHSANTMSATEGSLTKHGCSTSPRHQSFGREETYCHIGLQFSGSTRVLQEPQKGQCLGEKNGLYLPPCRGPTVGELAVHRRYGLRSPTSYEVDQRQELEGRNMPQREQEAPVISHCLPHGACLSQVAGSRETEKLSTYPC